jgi:Mor family transcriptional regulator
MSDVQTLAAALRVIRKGRPFASRDGALWGRIQALYTVLGGSGDSDEAVIIRALAELADVRQASLAAANTTLRRKTDALAARARAMTALGHPDYYIAGKLHRSVDSVRRWRRERS